MVLSFIQKHRVREDPLVFRLHGHSNWFSGFFKASGRKMQNPAIRCIFCKLVGGTEVSGELFTPIYKADLRQGMAVEYVSCEPTESARELFDEDYEPVEEEQ